MKKIIPPVAIIGTIVLVTALIIFYGRGFRLDLGNKTIGSKGLLVASSQPNGAQIIINGKLYSATNTTINLDPDTYNVRLEKEGYSPWEKNIRIQGEVVNKVDAILFPTNPSLSPITVSGAINPQVSPDNSKIVFSISKNVANNQNTLNGNGVFVLDLADRPLGANRSVRQIAKNSSVSFEDAVFSWDPAGKKILAQVNKRYYLLDADILNTTPTDVTLILTTLFAQWEQESEALEKEKLSAVKLKLSEVMKSSAKILAWSPDETKILYTATSSATIPTIIDPPLLGSNPTTEERTIKPGRIYTYDIKEDKNFFIMDEADISDGLPLQWFPTSSQLLYTKDDKISVMDYDGANKLTLYAGPYLSNLVVPWPNGSKIAILTSLNPQPDSAPNIYAINIR